MTIQDKIVAKMPPAWQETIQALSVNILQPDVPLRLTLVGNFSVGKSSLLNMLLGTDHLFTAREEATALPTFIEFTDQITWQLIQKDGTTQSIDATEFSRVTTAPPENAACAALGLPIEWLRGVTVIDLPGLGSTSCAHRDYTLSQVQQSDVVLYLLAPCGPGKSDIDMLSDIRRYGKRIKILIAQWDVVEESVARGEQAPDLTRWAAIIERESGIKTRLTPASRYGLGKDDVLDFIARAKADIRSIRQQRLCAELLPLLQNAIGQNETAQQACETSSEESARMLHTELIERKTALLTLKQALHQQQTTDRDNLDKAAAKSALQCRSDLAKKLPVQDFSIKTEQDWIAFGNQGSEALREALARIASQLSTLSTCYGYLKLPPATLDVFNLRLPAPEMVESNDFLDIARINQLQLQLEAKQSEFSAREIALTDSPALDSTDEENTVYTLQAQRQQISSAELPRIVQRSQSGGGAAFGRIVGEFADVALMFIQPAAAGAKVASLLGKGAKAVNLSVNATKVAHHMGYGLKVTKGASLGTKVRGIPAPVMQKLGFLEILSLGYWGERLGNMIDGSPTEHATIDPAAQAEQEQALASLDQEIYLARRELRKKEDFANENQLNKLAVEKNKQERAKLEFDLKRLQSKAETRQREAQAEINVAQQEQVQLQVQRAIDRWLGSYDQQANAMDELLRVRARQHWEERVDATLETNLVELQSFQDLISAAPQKKATEIARLRSEADSIRELLHELTE